jgi:hypothetical protein
MAWRPESLARHRGHEKEKGIVSVCRAKDELDRRRELRGVLPGLEVALPGRKLWEILRKQGLLASENGMKPRSRAGINSQGGTQG